MLETMFGINPSELMGVYLLFNTELCYAIEP